MSKTLFFTLFLFIFLIITPRVEAGSGQITGIHLEGAFTDETCKGVGEPGKDVVPRDGAGTKTFYFSPNSNTRGRCVIIISFRGDPGFAEGPVGGDAATVNANETYTYNFSTSANGGNQTENTFYYRFDVVGPGSPPPPPPPPVSAPPAGCGNNCSVSGYVYLDINRDGVYNGGDQPLFAEPVVLIQPGGSGNVTGSTTTNGSGYWSMGGLPPGSYGFRHNRLIAGYVRTTPEEVTISVNSNQNVSFGVANNNTPPPTPMVTPTPNVTPTPAPTFYQNNPIPSCSGPTPITNLSWSPSSGAVAYEIFYMDSENGTLVDTNTTTADTSYNANSAMGLVSGRSYSFIIAALNSSNQIIAYSDGLWSHQRYGSFSEFRHCRAPENFDFVVAPLAYCAGIGDSRYRISWTPSEYAQYYLITPQTNNSAKGNNGWIPAIEIRNPQLDASGNINFDYPVPGAIVSGEGWEFTVTAFNSFTSTGITGGSSFYVFGNAFMPAFNCSTPPGVNLSLNTPNGTSVSGGLPAFINQNTNATLNWSVTGANTNTCLASVATTDGTSVPAGMSSAWGGIKGPPPSGGGPINIPTPVPGTFILSMTCSNFAGSNSSSIQLNVEQYPKPYIQTTGGDVHTNETIYITP